MTNAAAPVPPTTFLRVGLFAAVTAVATPWLTMGVVAVIASEPSRGDLGVVALVGGAALTLIGGIVGLVAAAKRPTDAPKRPMGRWTFALSCVALAELLLCSLGCLGTAYLTDHASFHF